jgi:hypothetical protein
MGAFGLGGVGRETDCRDLAGAVVDLFEGRGGRSAFVDLLLASRGSGRTSPTLTKEGLSCDIPWSRAACGALDG